MKPLSFVVFFVLTVVAGFHVYWAQGGLWPAASERELINTVVGDANMMAMPSASATLIVATLILTAAFVGLAAGGVIDVAPLWLARLASAGAALVFLARGIMGYFFEAVAWAPVEPFATLNVWAYSPLCFLIGVAFVVITISPQRN